MDHTGRNSNHLINEKSPYLLQHAYNPVNWFPWSDEAFQKARVEDKPVFLSIGYSTCHWCHVMEHESFEDEQVAQVMNSDFIAIKVDREERPDIDAVYMSVCQTLTGSGGWPLTILMTPDQKPFYAGTYIPKHSRYSMPGLIELLENAARQWQTDRKKLLEAGEEILTFLAGQTEQAGKTAMSPGKIFSAKSSFLQMFDREYGGFGSSPKFPTPHNLMFLLRCYMQERDPYTLAAVEKTLQQMYRGGIFDHIGGGFSRYSTDRRWLVPHFEKMLYDNALLAMAYAETYQVTGKDFYKRAAQKILQYVLREMASPEGGFYSAQDADSEGVEGKYYVFTPDEIINLLGGTDGSYFNHYFGITAQGNFEDRNIPNLLENPHFDIPDDKIEALLPKVYEYRLDRTNLPKDDKILTSWNALMIAALAKASRILDEKEYLRAAEKAMSFLENNLEDGEGGFRVRWRDGEAAGTGNLDDYAFVIWALIELYDATFRPGYLRLALRLNRKMLDEFEDRTGGGFFLTPKTGTALIFRPKETYDGAVPSGNSVAGYCLERLARLTGGADLEEATSRQMQFLADSAAAYPLGGSFTLMAQMLGLFPGTEIVACIENQKDLDGLKQLLNQSFAPNRNILVISNEWADEIHSVAEFTKTYMPKEGQSTYYVCRGKSCSRPITDLSDLKKMLQEDTAVQHQS
ncbi:MAG TPA: thioredoxin domain-containing protein [Caproicibacter sp.]|nr:thioredoxin domain-containing protein [Caproicibacter sp.]